MKTVIVWTMVACSLSPADGLALSPDEWRTDLDQLVALIQRDHPDAFTRISREEFTARADRIRRSLDSMSDAQAAVELMRLTASIRDGHTTLHPVDPTGFNQWFPVSFYRFRDGVFRCPLGKGLRCRESLKIRKLQKIFSYM